MPSVSRSPSAFWDLLFGSVIIYLRMRIVVVVDGEGAIKRFWIKSLTLGNTRLTTNDKVNTDGRFINEPYLLRGVTMVLQTSAVYVPLYCNSIINIGDSVVSYAPTTKCVCRRNKFDQDLQCLLDSKYLLAGCVFFYRHLFANNAGKSTSVISRNLLRCRTLGLRLQFLSKYSNRSNAARRTVMNVLAKIPPSWLQRCDLFRFL
jgi:hypothetical protein